MADKQKETTIITNEEKQLVKKIDEVTIKNMIHVIRGKQVMLDSDLAMLYQVETKKFNQSVKRNIERFPERYCFQLTEQEFETLRSQFVTSNEKQEKRGGRRYRPFAFTEQGIAMLSAIIHSEVAVRVSIGIMDAFVTMRRLIDLIKSYIMISMFIRRWQKSITLNRH